MSMLKTNQSNSHSGISGKHLDTARSDKRGWFKEWLKEWWMLLVFGVCAFSFLGVCVYMMLTPLSKADAFDNPNRFRIEAGGNSVGVALVTDRDTGVQYLMNTHSGTFTVLIDKDGKPYLANGWRDYDGK